jgi:hypothetical protein
LQSVFFFSQIKTFFLPFTTSKSASMHNPKISITFRALTVAGISKPGIVAAGVESGADAAEAGEGA